MEKTELGDRDRFSPCEWCHESFRPPKPTGRRPKYCKPACRQAAYEARRDKWVGDEAVAAHAQGRPRRRISGSVAPSSPAVQAGPELTGAESPPLF
ncbi:hypothetical protein ACPC54_41230 [Kitasatospora sp. NPDC094028]